MISVLLTSVLPNELGRDVQQNLTGKGGREGGSLSFYLVPARRVGSLSFYLMPTPVDLQKTLYSCTVCSMIFSSAEAVPLPVYGEYPEQDY